MIVRQAWQNVSVAYRPNKVDLGANLRVQLSVVVDGDMELDFQPYLNRVKERLDHRCFDKPSTLAALTEFVARDLFCQPLPESARWSEISVSELERFTCARTPDSDRLRSTVRHRNLSLELEGCVAPEEIIRQIDDVFNCFHAKLGESEADWAARLAGSFKERIPLLCALTVDLGSHRLVRADIRR